MAIEHLRPPRGMRDFLPAQQLRRQWVADRLREVFEQFGYAPMDTPALEYFEVLSGKGGPEAERLMFHFTDAGGRELGLRYDLTVPLARVAAMNPSLPKPFRRYQVGAAWRAEKPQKGRFREFLQGDVDAIGSTSSLLDAELIAVAHRGLTVLGFRPVVVKVNDRRVLNGLVRACGVAEEAATSVLRALDKLDKVGGDGVAAELAQAGLAATVVGSVLELLALPEDRAARVAAVANRLGSDSAAASALAKLGEIFAATGDMGVGEDSVRFEPTLARGLDYYTGPVFEAVLGERPEFGSLCGGGRYDGLIGVFSPLPAPATGISFGLDRIVAVMEELGFPPPRTAAADVLVTLFAAASRPASLRLAARLRAAGLRVEQYPEEVRLSRQLAHADRQGIPLVAVIGPDEQTRGEVTLKHMRSGEQHAVPEERVAQEARRLLAAAARNQAVGP